MSSHQQCCSWWLKRHQFLLLSCLFFLASAGVHAQPDPVILGSGNTGGINVNTSDNNNGPDGLETLNGGGLLPNETAASRFLSQATLGADLETIQATAQMSFSQWIDDQFNTPGAFTLCDFTRDITIMALDSTFSMGGDPNDIEVERWYWHTAWWQYTMTSPDVLRNRIALALSEIFVVSELPVLGEVPLSLPNYYDMLLDNSFGNFRDLLEDVTLHPAMGLYLTHVNNPKSDESLNRYPDENYAREIMQLFTIGLYELNIDGTRQTDNNGDFIPTYDHDDIANFAKVFTGLTYPNAIAFGQDPLSELSFVEPMKMVNTWHEPGEKFLLNNFTVPDRSPKDGMADIQDALDNLFNHPNVGPFISYRLIQRLIRSNPSPEFVGRVAAKFNNNGQGVRGDMKAVIKAILLDEEARDCAMAEDPFDGMLREPIVRYTQICRAFNAFSEEGLYRNYMNDFRDATGQRPLGATSVFNFFQTDFQPIGPVEEAGLFAPEFQITNSVTILGYANRLHDWLMKTNQVMEYRDIFPSEINYDEKRVNFDLTDELALEEDHEIGELIERLNLILLHGQLSDGSREIIRGALEEITDEDDYDIRVRLAIFLVMISPDYLILR